MVVMRNEKRLPYLLTPASILAWKTLQGFITSALDERIWQRGIKHFIRPERRRPRNAPTISRTDSRRYERNERESEMNETVTLTFRRRRYIVYLWSFQMGSIGGVRIGYWILDLDLDLDEGWIEMKYMRTQWHNV